MAWTRVCPQLTRASHVDTYNNARPTLAWNRAKCKTNLGGCEHGRHFHDLNIMQGFMWYNLITSMSKFIMMNEHNYLWLEPKLIKPAKLTPSVMTHHILRHDAPCLFLLLNWTSLNTVTTHQLVRHDGLHMSVMTLDSASWRTIQNYFVCPIQGANSRVPSWRTTCCVTTDYTSPSQRTSVRHGGPCKNNFPQFPEANSDPSVMTVGLPSRRTILNRHDARLCVMTHCTKQFCPDCQ